MARFSVLIPVLAVVDTGSASATSNDQAIALATAWLVLPANSGMVVASKIIDGSKTYEAPVAEAGAASNPANTRTAGTGVSQVKAPLA